MERSARLSNDNTIGTATSNCRNWSVVHPASWKRKRDNVPSLTVSPATPLLGGLVCLAGGTLYAPPPPGALLLLDANAAPSSPRKATSYSMTSVSTAKDTHTTQSTYSPPIPPSPAAAAPTLPPQKRHPDDTTAHSLPLSYPAIERTSHTPKRRGMPKAATALPSCCWWCCNTVAPNRQGMPQSTLATPWHDPAAAAPPRQLHMSMMPTPKRKWRNGKQCKIRGIFLITKPKLKKEKQRKIKSRNLKKGNKNACVRRDGHDGAKGGSPSGRGE